MACAFEHIKTPTARRRGRSLKRRMLGALAASSVVLRSVSRSTVMTAAPTVSYHIGTHGKPWSVDERKQWLAERMVHRSYKEEVVAKLDALRERSEYEILEYGALSHDASRYPLYAVKSRDWDVSKPTALVSRACSNPQPQPQPQPQRQPQPQPQLRRPTSASASASTQAQVQAHAPTPRQVTGGVHGYETSGVQGALLFLQALHMHCPRAAHLALPMRYCPRTAHARPMHCPCSVCAVPAYVCAVPPADGGRGVRCRLQPAGRTLCQPVGVRDGATVERAGRSTRTEPLVQTRTPAPPLTRTRTLALALALTRRSTRTAPSTLTARWWLGAPSTRRLPLRRAAHCWHVHCST